MVEFKFPDNPLERAWAYADAMFVAVMGAQIFLRPSYANEGPAFGVVPSSKSHPAQLLYFIVRVNAEETALEKMPVWLEPVEFWTCAQVAALARMVEQLGKHGATSISAEDAETFFGDEGGNG